MKLPQVLTDFNTAIDGEGFAGVANKITIPEIVFKTIEKDLTGNAGAYDILTGRIEKLESEIEFSTFSASSIWALLGSADSADKPVIFKGSLKDGAEDIPIKLIFQGVWKSGAISDFEVSGEVSNKFKVSLQKLSLYINDEEKIYINMPTWEVRMNGVDLASQIKSNLGL